MQHTTTATAPKRGMKLQLFNNPKSLSKAQELRPDVRFYSLQRSDVLRSDGRTYARCEFFLIGSEIWACCDCHAAKRALPCYHVAAAALSSGILSVPAGTPLAVEDRQLDEATLDVIERYEAARDRFHPSARPLPEEIASYQPHYHACRYCSAEWRCTDAACAEAEAQTCAKSSCQAKDAPLVRPAPRNVAYTIDGWEI